MYCGDANEVFHLDYDSHKLKQIDSKLQDIDIDGRKVTIAVNHIELNHRSRRIHFGLIALQEIHAYYAQLLAEERHPGVKFSVDTISLPSFPYKFGDFLFREFSINIDPSTKFALIDLCLDTIQAPTVFLKVLEKLRGQTVTFMGNNATDLMTIVDQVNEQISHSNQEAYNQIIPDLKRWASDPSRKFLSEALGWYIQKVEMVKYMKENASRTFFSLPFCMDMNNFSLFYSIFPPPVFYNNGVFFRNMSMDIPTDQRFNKEFEAATTIWAHRMLFDLLCSETIENFQHHAACPLYENCETRGEIGEDYTCKTAPWEIVKNPKKIFCQYGMAAHSFGLWQNTIEVEI